MELAIQHSNNAATNWMLRKVGGPKAAERILQRKYPGIFQDTRIVEIAKDPDGKRYPYTVIGIIEKEQRARDYSTWIRSRGAVIRNVSRIIYHGIAKRYDFY